MRIARHPTDVVFLTHLLLYMTVNLGMRTGFTTASFTFTGYVTHSTPCGALGH